MTLKLEIQRLDALIDLESALQTTIKNQVTWMDDRWVTWIVADEVNSCKRELTGIPVHIARQALADMLATVTEEVADAKENLHSMLEDTDSE